tara:strand:- start:1080 stop:1700 length:621 start_codon:yes stop_codon:yes gene_type:complete
LRYKKESILVIDDEKSIRVSLGAFFEKEKYKVNTAKNSNLALNYLSNNSYDYVLTDIIMAGSSGIDLLKKIKEQYPKTLVLLMTGYANLNSAIDALRLGASDYLIKPCSNEDILSSIKNAKKNNTREKNIQFENINFAELKIVSGERPLTKKELLALEFLFYGMKLEEIAIQLDVTLATVKFHLKNLYRKLGIKGRREIVNLYYDK